MSRYITLLVLFICSGFVGAQVAADDSIQSEGVTFTKYQPSSSSYVKELINIGEITFTEFGVQIIRDVKPGHTVWYEWTINQDYFMRVLGWNFFDFCNATIKINPKLSDLFTKEQGCNNPGFRKMPAGVAWNMPTIYTVHTNESLDLDAGETVILEEIDGLHDAAIMSKEMAFARLASKASKLVSPEDAIDGFENAIRALGTANKDDVDKDLFSLANEIQAKQKSENSSANSPIDDIVVPLKQSKQNSLLVGGFFLYLGYIIIVLLLTTFFFSFT